MDLDDIHYYEPSKGHGLRHNPFNAIIAPRPIGWISSQNAQGQLNLAPYSFFNAFNYDPPILGFASIAWKDSVQNASETKEFVWNLVTKDLGEQMNKTAAPLPRGVSEFELAGLATVPSRHVSVPRVRESRAAMECKVTEIVKFKNWKGESVEGWLVLGEVVAVYIDKALIKDGVYQTALAHPILRAGRGGDYVEVTEDRMFEMDRPAGSSSPAFHGS
ncbi:flavin reductase family protein [Bradyrhizobium sp. CCBAU 53338]|uniref:flavin reductase family protein n=1 Tax=Bradyrhizobium sp. CCBAU 53338 TaxID=1325111 RepID=UPI001889E385|nr:flavin reductase family protein [Bradyrhizobium sp. CCBAU 53338]QOZ51512.1 flavin reductase family protein [Bradyrhizobium sp. CCBAU 53338]